MDSSATGRSVVMVGSKNGSRIAVKPMIPKPMSKNTLDASLMVYWSIGTRTPSVTTMMVIHAPWKMGVRMLVLVGV